MWYKFACKERRKFSLRFQTWPEIFSKPIYLPISLHGSRSCVERPLTTAAHVRIFPSSLVPTLAFGQLLPIQRKRRSKLSMNRSHGNDAWGEGTLSSWYSLIFCGAHGTSMHRARLEYRSRHVARRVRKERAERRRPMTVESPLRSSCRRKCRGCRTRTKSCTRRGPLSRRSCRIPIRNVSTSDINDRRFRD